jgi:hypothetical protein
MIQIMKAVLLLLVCCCRMYIYVGVIIINNDDSAIGGVELHVLQLVTCLRSLMGWLRVLLRLNNNLVRKVASVIYATSHSCRRFNLLLIKRGHAIGGGLFRVLNGHLSILDHGRNGCRLDQGVCLFWLECCTSFALYFVSKDLRFGFSSIKGHFLLELLLFKGLLYKCWLPNNCTI